MGKIAERTMEGNVTELTKRDILRKDIRNGGIGSIVFGLVWWIPLGIYHNVPVLTIGGIILAIEGLLCVAIQQPAMIIVDGLTLMSIGAMNLLAGMSFGSHFWAIFGGFQIYSGIKRMGSYTPNAKAWLEAGHGFAKSGEFGKAEACYNNALRKDPAISHSIPQLMAEAHNLRGATLFQKGEADNAIGEYKQALQIDDNLAITHYNLGVALEKRMESDAALMEFQTYLRLEPKGQWSRNARKAIERIEQKGVSEIRGAEEESSPST